MRSIVIGSALLLAGCQDGGAIGSERAEEQRFEVRSAGGEVILTDGERGDTWILVTTRFNAGELKPKGVQTTDTQVKSWEKIPMSDSSYIKLSE